MFHSFKDTLWMYYTGTSTYDVCMFGDAYVFHPIKFNSTNEHYYLG